MQLCWYSHCAVGPGGPLAVCPPECCCLFHFFFTPLVFSQSSRHTFPTLSKVCFFPLLLVSPVSFREFSDFGCCVLKPYLLTGGMLVYWLPAVCFPPASSLHFPEKSVKLIKFERLFSFLLCALLLRSGCRLLKTTQLRITVVFVLCVSNFCLPSSFYTPPPLPSI